MSVVIDCEGQEILRLSNSLFGLLHRTIISVIEEKQLKISDELKLLLNKTDQDNCGPGSFSPDLDKFLKNKDEVLLFADLVDEAIKLKYDNFNQFIGCIDHLNNFHNELLKYAEDLRN